MTRASVGKGYLDVDTNGKGEVVINHPELEPNDDGSGHLTLSVDQAERFAAILNETAAAAVREVGPKVGSCFAALQKASR